MTGSPFNIQLSHTMPQPLWLHHKRPAPSHTQSNPPPAAIHLSPISDFFLNDMFHRLGRLDLRAWTKRDCDFINVHSSAYDVNVNRTTKVIPTLSDGMKMAARYRTRTYDQAKEMGTLIKTFSVPYSELRCIHGSSKLRLEVTVDSSTTDDAATGGINFGPVRKRPYVRRSPILPYNPLWLIRPTSAGNFVLSMRPISFDLRAKAIPPRDDAAL